MHRWLLLLLVAPACHPASDAADGDGGEDSGDSAADSGDTAADSGDSGADSGDTAADSGDSTADSGDSGADSGDTAADSGDSAADSGDSGSSAPVDADGDGATTRIDCDDTRADVFPGAPEVCDGIDDDCDGLVDDADPDLLDPLAWYADADADGYGDPGAVRWACVAPAGTIADASDCDDASDAIHPGAAEACDDVDADCDPSTAGCDGVCDGGETGEDCDGICDPGETGADCDGTCGPYDAGADAGGPDCDGACDALDDGAGWDCDGACAEGEAGPDCDGACDVGDALAGADCAGEVVDGSCGWGDGAGNPDCDGLCDDGDGAGSPDCDGLCDAGDAGPDCPTGRGLPTGVDLWLEGIDDDGYAGFSVAGVGDLDGDGFDDLLIGVPNAAPDGLVGAGRVFVVHGAADLSAVTLADVADGVGGFAIDGDIGDWDVDLVLCRGTVTHCGETTTVAVGAFDGYSHGPAGPGFGFAVRAAGDFDGDGVPDLLVGAPFGRPSGRLYAGEAFLVSGAAAGPDLSLAALAEGSAPEGLALLGDGGADQWNTDVTSGDGDLTGFTLGGGFDLDGDGLTDLVAGAPGGGDDDEGRIVVVPGTPATAAVDARALADGAHVVTGYTPDYALVPAEFGWILDSVGDVDGDGYGDLATQPQPFGGEFGTLLVRGAADAADVALDDGGDRVLRVEHGSFSFTCLGSTACDLTGQFLEGYAVAGGGDVNGDGYADFVIRGTAEGAVAQAWVVLGGPGVDGLNLEAPGAGAWSVGGDVAGSDPWPDGAALVRDLDGDGLDEVVVTAPQDSPDGVDGAGRLWVALGRTGTDAVTLDDLAAGADGFAVAGTTTDEGLGFSVASAGDLDGDGYADLLVGAPSFDDGGGGGARGRIGIVFGGDFRGVVTAEGGPGADHLVGTSAVESFVAGRGDDTIDGGGGADVIYAGPGDDTLVLRDGSARRVDGGTGTDRLQLVGLGDTSTAALRGHVQGIEIIELGTGTTSLTLASVDVGAASPTSNELVVLGAGTVHAADGDWAWGGEDEREGEPVELYHNGPLTLAVGTALDADFPPAIADADAVVAEDAARGTPIATLTATDPDGAVVAWRLADDADGRFAIADGVLTVLGGLDFETEPALTLVVEVTDDDGRTAQAEVSVTVEDADEAPVFGAAAWLYTVDEGSLAGTAVGTVYAADPDAGDAVSYALSLDGSTVGAEAGPFGIDDDGAIVVADPTDLDFETAPTWELWVVATDLAGNATLAPLTVEVGDVDSFRSALTLGFSTADRGIWSSDGSIPFDFDVVSGTVSVPSGEPTVTDLPYPGGSAELSLDVGGDFDFTVAAEVDLGSVAASLPLDLVFTVPDHVVAGEPFTLESTWALGDGALFWGDTPAYAFTLSLQATDVVVEASVCWTSSSCEGLATDSYSMASPAELSYASDAEHFVGERVGDAEIATPATVATTLLDQDISWEDTLYTTLDTLGVPTMRGEFAYGESGDAVSAEVAYVWWWSTITLRETLASDFALTVEGVDGTFTFEDGSTLDVALGGATSVTVPIGADADGDGHVRYSLTVSPAVRLRHTGEVTSTGEHDWWAGQLDADVYSFGALADTRSLGPLYSRSASLSADQSYDLDFVLEGFNSVTVRGVIDLD